MVSAVLACSRWNSHPEYLRDFIAVTWCRSAITENILILLLFTVTLRSTSFIYIYIYHGGSVENQTVVATTQ